jgi:hypothetical protein
VPVRLGNELEPEVDERPPRPRPQCLLPGTAAPDVLPAAGGLLARIGDVLSC